MVKKVLVVLTLLSGFLRSLKVKSTLLKQAIALFFILLFAGTSSAQELVIYSIPQELYYRAHNDDYTAKVRLAGKDWQDLYEYKVQVDLDKVQEASMVTFGFNGKVEIMVRKNNGMVQNVRIRPENENIIPEVKGNIVYFTLAEPKNLSVEFNGDRLHNLHVFANSIDEDKPDINDPNVLYFGPGFHKPDQNGVFKIPSGKQVYVDGGAVLNGKLLVDSARDVKISGHGIIFEPERGIEITHSSNIIVENLIFINPRHYTVYGGSSNNIFIKNIRSFSCRGWSDGIDMMSCSDVNIDHVFMRNSDDCIAIYGHRWDFYGSSRNFTVQNSVLWADIAHPINIGLHGNAEDGGDTIENIVFRNIDILEHDEDDRNYQGCMALTCSDNNLVQNIRFENIRVDDFQEGQLLNFRVLYNEKYSGAPGKGIKNVTLKNISYNGFGANPSVIHGYNKERTVENVTIENLVINGEKIKSAHKGNTDIGNFTKEVHFK